MSWRHEVRGSVDDKGGLRFSKDPFFVLRAGLNLELLPSLFFDFNVNYRFEEWKDLQDRDTRIDSDTVMLGAALRFAF